MLVLSLSPEVILGKYSHVFEGHAGCEGHEYAVTALQSC